VRELRNQADCSVSEFHQLIDDNDEAEKNICTQTKEKKMRHHASSGLGLERVCFCFFAFWFCTFKFVSCLFYRLVLF